MPCVRIGKAIVNIGNPTETVTMCSGRILEVEWGDYFGPAVVTRNGLRNLTNKEFHDPNVDAWIVAHGAQSCLGDTGPLLPRARKRRPEKIDLTKPPKAKIIHKVKHIDRNGNSSALCFEKPRAIDLSREGCAAFDDAGVTCPACRKIMDRT